jgi:hypothetical protein
MIVDPWGVVACELGGEEGEPEIATAEIDHELLKKVRREMPLARRTYVLDYRFQSPCRADGVYLVMCTRRSERYQSPHTAW